MQAKKTLNNNGYVIEVSSLSKTVLKNTIQDLTAIPYKLDATKEEMEAAELPLYRMSKCKEYITVPDIMGYKNLVNLMSLILIPSK